MRRWDEGEQHGGSERVSERRNSRKRFGPLSGRFVLPRAIARVRVERSKAKDSNGDSWRISPLPNDERNLSIWTWAGGVTKCASTRLLWNTLFVSKRKMKKDVENMIFRFFYRCILRTGNRDRWMSRKWGMEIAKDTRKRLKLVQDWHLG